MRGHWLWLAPAILLSVTCHMEEGIGPDAVTGQINFEAPAAGQLSRYVLWIGEDYRSDANNNFVYQSDTMEIEILEWDEMQGWLIEERLSSGSASLHGAGLVAFPDRSFRYYLNIVSDTLRLIPQQTRYSSRIFFLPSFENHALPLGTIIRPTITMQGWKTIPRYFDNYAMGAVPECKLIDRNYNQLNVVIDNRNMQSVGTGYTHYYSGTYGLVRSSQYNLRSNKGYGWDLIPEEK